MGIFAELYDEELRHDQQRNGDPCLFRMLSENLKLDRDVMVAANQLWKSVLFRHFGLALRRLGILA